LLVCNGSPRAAGGNTELLLDALLGGFAAGGGEVTDLLHLVRPAHAEEAVRRFPREEAVLLAFPLYVDALPAPAVAFVQALAPLAGRPDNPALSFLVQSGFPEALHSRPVERYLEKLARRLGSRHLGTIVKGGVEGIRSQPPRMRRRILEPLERLGGELAARGRLERAALARFAEPERYRLGLAGALRLAIHHAVSRAWWNAQLRANGALAERDARPYEP
jgi:hypothetical protein